ncbi:DNA polymerase III subunit gamma/tau [Advenella sp. RU8]|uniref:DNA polymerase III subunit gamma/tau n=1 Tax=Advenella sp. RU8 TaxID=3399575 RepID=UPI003AAE7733
MSYLVLARKWRPRSFETLVGQEHVVRALSNALNTQRLHHAWLFTGTRGVGKTTLSRILAKSLNCETGITATPCGQCRACVEIDEGRFVDYLEFDAASNRRVEEMTQLLEQAVYAPSAGRFKIYMIDEVHMLTGHAFNAMLKTLEEPPPHVKFILATTDPQKIPVTVLSRCLQFNLKQMPPEAIVGHLQNVLVQEDVRFDLGGLRLIAQAASGSMRDALSLTDQAIAYSSSNITDAAVREMLGTIDQKYLVRFLQALLQGSAQGVMDTANELSMRGFSYSGALADLSVLLSRIAIEQRLPGTLMADDPLHEDMQSLARAFHPDTLQLFYSIAVHGRNELSLAPDEYAGFVMTGLRMLSLVSTVDMAALPDTPVTKPLTSAPVAPQGNNNVPASPAVAISAPASGAQTQTSAGIESATCTDSSPAASLPEVKVDEVIASSDGEPATSGTTNKEASPVSAGPVADTTVVGNDDVRGAEKKTTDDFIPAWEDIPADWEMLAASEPDDEARFEQAVPSGLDMDLSDPEIASFPVVEEDVSWVPSHQDSLSGHSLQQMTPHDWTVLSQKLPLSGVAAEFAKQSEWLGVEDNEIHLRIPVKNTNELGAKAKLNTVLTEYFRQVVKVSFEYAENVEETAYASIRAEQAARQEKAERAVHESEFINALIEEFDAKVIPESIKPC